MRSGTLAQVTGGVQMARVIDTSRLVVLDGTVAGGLGHALLETTTGTGTFDTLVDHLLDGGLGARALALAGGLAGMRLHETRVANTVTGGLDTNAAIGLLHHEGEDEAGLKLGFFGDFVDGLLDAVDLLVGIVGRGSQIGAGFLQSGQAIGESA